MKTFVFEYYRYQLVPKSTVQLSIDNVPYTVEEIKAKKNEYFAEVVAKAQFKSHRNNLPYKLIHKGDSLFYLWLCNVRNTAIYQDFRKKKVKSEPFVDILIDNNPERQIIAISRNKDAFENSNVVIRILTQTFNKYLDYFNIVIHIQPIVTSSVFWSAIKSRGNELDRITFELIKPNITNISERFKGDMRELIESTNSHETTLSLRSPQRGTLDGINEKNERVKALVDYSSVGGGNIKYKFKNDRKVYQTSDNIRVESINTYFEAENASPDSLEFFIKSIMDKLL